MQAEKRRVFRGLFPNDPPKGKPFIEVMPVSIVELERRRNQVIRKTFVMDQSSRVNYSPFPREVAMLCYDFFLKDCKRIFDPFAGWGERHYYAKSYGKKYTGFDTNPVAIEYAKGQFGVDNTLANSLTADIPAFDGLLTCPPYWNIEVYGGEGGIDLINDWQGFLDQLEQILKRSFDAAKPGSLFCVMAGDWRAKGVYYDLMFQIESMFQRMGALPYDKLVVSRKALTPIQFYLAMARKHKFSVKLHEYLVVFRKPSGRIRVKAK